MAKTKRQTGKRQVIGIPPNLLKDIEVMTQDYERVTGVSLSRIQAVELAVNTMLMIQAGKALYQTKETVAKRMKEHCSQAAALARVIAASKGEVTNIHAVPLGVMGQIDGTPHVWQIYEQEPEQFFKIVKDYLERWHPETDIKAVSWHTIKDPRQAPDWESETITEAAYEQTAIPLRVPDQQEIEQS